MDAIITTLNNYSSVFTSYFWSIVWQSSLLILIITATVLLFRKVSPNVKYLLWLLVVVRLLLPPAFYLPTGISNWGRLIVPERSETPDVVVTDLSNAAVPANSFVQLPSDAYVQPVATTTPLSVTTQMSLNSGLLIAWGCGFLILTGVLVFKLIQFRHMVRSATPPPDYVRTLLGSINDQFRIKRRIEVKVTDKISSPVVGGFFKPVIILPEQVIRDLNKEELAPIIAHELAHIKRIDWIVNWIQIFAGIVFFFHPLIWYANRRIRIEREKACDDLVLLTMEINPKSYINSLLKIVNTMSRRMVFNLGLVGVVEPRSHLGKRVARIMNDRIRRRRGISILSIAGILLFAGCFMTYSDKPEGESEGISTTPSKTLQLGETPEDLKKVVLEGFRENRDRLKNVVLSWNRTIRQKDIPDISEEEVKLLGLKKEYQLRLDQEKMWENRGTYHLWWDGKRIATKYVQEYLREQPDGSVKKDKFERGNLYRGSVFSHKIEFKPGENYLKSIRWSGSKLWTIDTTIERIKKGDWSTLEVDGSPMIRLVLKSLKDEPSYCDEYLFDPSRGCNLVHFEWHDNQGRICQESNMKLQEVRGGVWFPVEVDSKVGVGKYTTHIHSVLDMEQCSFNDASAIPDGVFRRSFVQSFAVDIQTELTKILKEMYEKQKDRKTAARTYKKRERAVDSVKRLIAAARAGDAEGIRKYIDSKSINPEGVLNSVETISGGFSLEALSADDKKAMVISSVIHADTVTEPLVFYLKNIDGEWLIWDIDFENLKIVQRELSKLLKEQPDATMILLSTRFPEYQDVSEKALKDRELSKTYDLEKVMFDLILEDKILSDPEKQKKLDMFMEQIEDSVKVLLYSQMGEDAAEKEGRTLHLDKDAMELTVIDYPENLDQAEKYLSNIPEVRVHIKNRGKFERTRDISQENDRLLETQTLRQEQEWRYRDLSVRLLQVNENNPDDTEDDTAEFLLRTSTTRDNPTLRENQTYAIDEYEVYVKEIRPSGISGEGRVVIDLSYFEKETELITNEDNHLPKTKTLRKEQEWRYGGLSVRLLQVNENNPDDTEDDTAEFLLRTPTARKNPTIEEYETYEIDKYRVYVKEIRPSGISGEGRVVIDLSYFEKEKELIANEDNSLPKTKTLQKEQEWRYRDLSVRLLKVNENNPDDKEDDTAEFLLKTPTTRDNPTIGKYEIQAIDEYRVLVREIRPSGISGKGRVEIDMYHFEKETESITNEDNSLPKTKTLQKEQEWTYRDFSVRLLRVNENNPDDTWDDTAEFLLRTPTTRDNPTINEYETHAIDEYEVFVKEIRPSGISGEGRVEIDLSYFEKEKESITWVSYSLMVGLSRVNEDISLQKTKTLRQEQE